MKHHGLAARYFSFTQLKKKKKILEIYLHSEAVAGSSDFRRFNEKTFYSL